jgi:hypothetical protein
MPPSTVNELIKGMSDNQLVKDRLLLDMALSMEDGVELDPTSLVVLGYSPDFTEIYLQGRNGEKIVALSTAGNVYMEPGLEYNPGLEGLVTGVGASPIAGGQKIESIQLRNRFKEIFLQPEYGETLENTNIGIMQTQTGLLANEILLKSIFEFCNKPVNFIVAKDAHSSVFTPLDEMRVQAENEIRDDILIKTRNIYQELKTEQALNEDKPNNEKIKSLQESLDFQMARIPSVESRIKLRSFTIGSGSENDNQRVKAQIKSRMREGHINIVIANGMGSTTGMFGPWKAITELGDELEQKITEAKRLRAEEIKENRESNIEIPEGIITMMDDAHNILAGKDGKGTFGILGTKRPDIVTGTFSKILRSMGGLVAAHKKVVQILGLDRRNIFSAGVPDVVSVPVLNRINYFQSHPEVYEKLVQNSNLLYDLLEESGMDVSYTHRDTPIYKITIPRIETDADDQIYQFRAVDIWTKFLKEEGVLAGLFTSVAMDQKKQSFMRVAITSNFSEQQIRDLAEKIIRFNRTGIKHPLQKVDESEKAGAAD